MKTIAFYDLLSKWLHCSWRCVIAQVRTGTLASKFLCTIYDTCKITVFSLCFVIKLNISRKEKCFIEDYTQEI